MVLQAIAELKDRKGASRPALKNYIESNWKIDMSTGMAVSTLTRALKKGIESGVLKEGNSSARWKTYFVNDDLHH